MAAFPDTRATGGNLALDDDGWRGLSELGIRDELALVSQLLNKHEGEMRLVGADSWVDFSATGRDGRHIVYHSRFFHPQTMRTEEMRKFCFWDHGFRSEGSSLQRYISDRRDRGEDHGREGQDRPRHQEGRRGVRGRAQEAARAEARRDPRRALRDHAPCARGSAAGPWVQISELKYFNFDFNLEEGRNIKI